MQKSVLIVGGNGQVGKRVVNKFVFCKQNPWNVYSLDFSENKYATNNIILDKNFGEETSAVESIHKQLGSDFKFNSIVCVAGGWEGVSLNDHKILCSMKRMMDMNFQSSVLACHLAQKYLHTNSLLALTGAAAVRKHINTTGALSYQLAKQGVENLTDTLINYPALLPINTKIVTICPHTIDTETNRKYIPGDRTNWVSPERIATLLKQWSENIKEAPRDTFYYI